MSNITTNTVPALTIYYMDGTKKNLKDAVGYASIEANFLRVEYKTGNEEIFPYANIKNISLDYDRN